MYKINKNNNYSNIIVNKKSEYNFIISKTFEAGLILFGWEVKALRQRCVNITNSYILIKLGEGFLINSQFNFMAHNCYDMSMKCDRIRKILLHKSQILYLKNKLINHQFSIIPISIYFKKQWCKLKIGLAQGKKTKDKREHQKSNEWKKQKKILINRF